MVKECNKITFVIIVLFCMAFPYLNAQNFKLSGFIEDGQTGERLIGAFVVDSISQKVTQTNNYGFFSITLTKGDLMVKATYVGYKAAASHLSLAKDTSLIFKLNPVTELQEVIIKAGLYNRNAGTPLGTILIPVKQLTNIPALGEADILKAIQQQPGIQGGIEGSAGLFVRGGWSRRESVPDR